jgi:hypothetical protein
MGATEKTGRRVVMRLPKLEASEEAPHIIIGTIAAPARSACPLLRPTSPVSQGAQTIVKILHPIRFGACKELDRCLRCWSLSRIVEEFRDVGAS